MPESTHPAPYHFERQARSLALFVVLLAWGLGLCLMWIIFQAAWFFLVLFALPLGPALWDLWRNPHSGLSIADGHFKWHHGGSKNQLPLSEIEKLRLDRRWDFSFRATLILRNGQKLRLPQPVLPQAEELENALSLIGIPSERHHFSVF